MVDWILVNGAKIEKYYLDENVAEAKKYCWKQARWEATGSHGHCLICNIGLSANDPCGCSEGGWLCLYCLKNFILGDKPATESKQADQPPA